MKIDHKPFINPGAGYSCDADCPACRPTEAAKDDSNKTQLELLPFAALEQVSKVLTFGAVKYAPHGYRHGDGLAWSRLLGAALRHLFAWGRGEDRDKETGLSHLAHAACCVLFLLTYEVDGGGNDDRFVK